MSLSLIYTSFIARRTFCRSLLTVRTLKCIKLHHSIRRCPSIHFSSSLPPVTSSLMKPSIRICPHPVIVQWLRRTLSSRSGEKGEEGEKEVKGEKGEKGGLGQSGGSIISELFESKRTEEEEKKLKEEAEKSRQNQIRATRYSLIVFGVMIGSGIVYAVSEWGPPRKDKEGKVIEDEFNKHHPVIGYVLRAVDTIMNYNEVLKEPIREKLLPDPLTYPYLQPKYTVVIELNGILVHPDWTYKTGWRFKKRPFLEYFLNQLTPPMFETVIFTQDPGWTATPVIDSMDPNQCIMYRLFRDSTRYVDGTRIKDCTMLNRDLNTVIHIEWNEKACSANPENCLVIPKWNGSDGDKSLFDLAQFLRAIAIQDVGDVRDVIRHYKQYPNPIEAFKERQRQLQVQEQEEMVKKSTRQKSLVESFKRK